jgi:DNA-directed RNA polymerase subunit RPC12/RpoP
MTPSARMAALVLCLRNCKPQWQSTGYRCTSCNTQKPIEDFYLRPDGRHEPRCRECRSKQALARYHAKRGNHA